MARSNSHFAYWNDMTGALHGYPSKTRLPPKPHQSGDPTSADWRERVRPETKVVTKDLTGWQSRLVGGTGARCVLSYRDRQGFRWEREVGLNDFVSQADAAQLLGLPLMRVNRWVRAGKLRSSKRRGYSVIRIKDLYELALELELAVPRGRRLVIIGALDEDE